MAEATRESPRDPRPTAQNFYFREFKGINTQADRTAIDDNEFAWLENLMPVGNANLRVVPAISAQLATVSPDVPYVGWAFNVNKVDYAYVITTNGAGYQILLQSPFTVTKFANAATFSSSGVDATQWKDDRVLFIDPSKGYFSWDGSILVPNGGVCSITITNGGSGYVSAPSVTLSGTATATATVSGGSVVSITITNPGSGYGTPPSVSFSGGGGANAAATANILLGPGMQGVQSITVTAGGTGYTSAPAVTISGGGGSGATATATVSGGAVTSVTITDTGTGYTSVPAVSFGGPGANAAAFTTLYPSGGGTSIATFSGRVWIANNRTIIFSAPDSFFDFTLNSSGGFFTISDATLHDTIQGMIAANNYLYILGKDSVDVLSDVRVVAGITLFTRVNVEATVGTAFIMSLIAYYRTIMFASKNGIFGLTGSTPQKASDALDGIIPLIDFTQPVSAGMVSIYNILCVAFCFTYNDPMQGPRQVQAIFFNDKWFVGSQGSVSFVFSTNIATQQNLYGMVGSGLYQLFSNTSTSATVSTKFESKLWDLQNPIVTKQMTKFGLWAVVPSALATTFNVTFDNEIGSSASVALTPSLNLNFVGTSAITFQGTSNIQFISSGLAPAYTDAQQGGKYLGYTITSTVPQARITLTEYEFFYRQPWGTPTP